MSHPSGGALEGIKVVESFTFLDHLRCGLQVLCLSISTTVELGSEINLMKSLTLSYLSILQDQMVIRVVQTVFITSVILRD